MGSGTKRLKSKLVPIAEHRQAKECDNCGLGDGGVAAGSLQKCSSGKVRHSKVLRPLVKLKDALAQLLGSKGGRAPQCGLSTAAFFSMGVIMGPVDFGGYEAVSSYFARENDCNSSSYSDWTRR